jgi:DNA-binding MarR family transcriptional regulator
MQQLQNASDPMICAGVVLQAVLEVLVTLREKTARKQAATAADGREHRKNSPIGPTLIHVRALGALGKRPGASLSMLADQLALTLSATSRLVDCLVEKGFVNRVIPPGNRRSVSLHLTPSGSKILDRKMAQTQRELARTLQRIPPSRRADLSRSMELLRAAIEAESHASPSKN